MSHIKVNMAKAKVIAHTARRAKRDVAYVPIDGGSMHAQLSPAGEALRQATKVSDDQVQIDIDNCTDDVALKAVMVAKGLID